VEAKAIIKGYLLSTLLSWFAVGEKIQIGRTTPFGRMESLDAVQGNARRKK
jgi:hypothetical protein